MTPTADSLQGFRNRIINGDMRIDQRNAGAEINPAVDATYYLDRWKVTSGAASKFKIGQNAGSVTPPTGFSNYLGCTSLSAYSVGATETFNITQVIEGFNFADMAWGTANAKTVTLSFWVRSSLTGTFGGSLRNSAVDRSYPFSYTISAANTWEQKTVTITGDTSGTWIGSTNGIGVLIGFSLGSGSSRVTTAGAWAASNYTGVTGQTNVVGTNGATFYITGVQLEVGSVATPFERRDYGRELALCQRYYFRIKPGSPGYYTTLFSYVTNSDSYGGVSFPVPMRIAPTALEQTGTASDYSQAFVGAGGACTGVPVFTAGTTVNVGLIKSVASSGHTAGQAGYMYASNSNSYLAWSAEL
jgi:hypothetical protein